MSAPRAGHCPARPPRGCKKHLGRPGVFLENRVHISMKKTFGRLLLNTFRIGFVPTKATRKAELQGLITRLHPLATEFDLIRLGPEKDGGYLVPDDLEGIEACFSPGVSTSSDFELACAQRGMQVFLADYSVDGPATRHGNFHFTKKFVGATTSERFMTMADWVRQAAVATDSDLLLQMDIEGYEYETLLSMPDELLKRFRIIVVEFHRLHHLWSAPFFRLAVSAFAKILQTHACVHLHPNNCRSSICMQGLEIPRVMEFTFFRKDRFRKHAYAKTFPHALDRDNTSNPHLALPACWYGGLTGGKTSHHTQGVTQPEEVT